jgi:hypothetical protein
VRLACVVEQKVLHVLRVPVCQLIQSHALLVSEVSGLTQILPPYAQTYVRIQCMIKPYEHPYRERGREREREREREHHRSAWARRCHLQIFAFIAREEHEKKRLQSSKKVRQSIESLRLETF